MQDFRFCCVFFFLLCSLVGTNHIPIYVILLLLLVLLYSLWGGYNAFVCTSFGSSDEPKPHFESCLILVRQVFRIIQHWITFLLDSRTILIWIQSFAVCVSYFCVNCTIFIVYKYKKYISSLYVFLFFFWVELGEIFFLLMWNIFI